MRASAVASGAYFVQVLPRPELRGEGAEVTEIEEEICAEAARPDVPQGCR